MGGFGSGRWYRWQGRKATVEESLVIAVGDFHRRRRTRCSGELRWRRGDRERTVGYAFGWKNGPTITLQYRLRRGDVRIPIVLQFTPTQFGGHRLWFTCPLTVNGVPCNRRVGKLYLPRGGRYFGCRACHDLSYRSSQEAHRAERLYAGNGRPPRPDRHWPENA